MTKRIILNLGNIDSIFLLDESLLEPIVLKGTRWVLRRERRSNPPDLSDYSYENYQIGISKYKIVPFIFPRDNFKRNKLNDQLSYPLQAFKKTKKIITEKRFYDNLKHELLKKLDNWKKFKTIRGKIEEFFKLLKQGLNMREIHKYTPKSVEKTVYLNVFLGALIISQGYYSKTAIQQLSEN